MTSNQEHPAPQGQAAKPVDTAVSLHDQVLALLEAGQLDEAERTFHEAIHLLRRELGPAELAVNYANLGTLYDGKGYHQQAERMYLAALEVFKSILPPAHPRVAAVRQALAELQGAAQRRPDPRP